MCFQRSRGFDGKIPWKLTESVVSTMANLGDTFKMLEHKTIGEQPLTLWWPKIFTTKGMHSCIHTLRTVLYRNKWILSSIWTSKMFIGNPDASSVTYFKDKCSADFTPANLGNTVKMVELTFLHTMAQPTFIYNWGTQCSVAIVRWEVSHALGILS